MAGDTGGDIEVVSSVGLGGVTIAVVGAGEERGEVGEENEADEGVGGSSSTAAMTAAGNSGESAGHTTGPAVAAVVAAAAIATTGRHGSKKIGAGHSSSALDPAPVDETAVARAKFEALQRQSARLIALHNNKMSDTPTTKRADTGGGGGGGAHDAHHTGA